MISKNAKMVLTLFAYLPLFAVITIRNLGLLHDIFLSYINLDFPKIYLFLIVLIIFIFIYYTFKSLVGSIFTKVETLAPRDIEVQIKSDKNTEMLGFLLTYIVPFCITFENGFYDLFAFFVLFVMIVYVYIETSLFCVNPLLNFTFGYNIYEIEMHNMDGFMLTTKKHRNIKKELRLYKITDDLWKEE